MQRLRQTPYDRELHPSDDSRPCTVEAERLVFRYGDGRNPGTYADPLVRALKRWQRVAVTSDLFSVDTGEHVVICDLRPGHERPFTVLDGVDGVIYRACNAIADRHSVQAAASQAAGEGVDESAMADRLDRLVEAGTLLRDGNRFLNLSVPLGEYVPSERVIDRFNRLVRSLGSRRSGRFVIATSRRRPQAGSRISGRSTSTAPSRRTSRGRRLDPSQFSVNASGDLVISPEWADHQVA